jgi:hypothetical protein
MPDVPPGNPNDKAPIEDRPVAHPDRMPDYPHDKARGIKPDPDPGRDPDQHRGGAPGRAHR